MALIEVTKGNLSLVAMALDTVARAILGSSTPGVSTRGNTAVILLHDSASGGDQVNANRILENWGTLVVSADKVTMAEGDADPVVSCADGAIASDGSVGYVVLQDGEVYDSGTDTLVGGESELTLSSPPAGVYDVSIYRLAGTYASGHVRITVSEAE